jgi:hypothetical protein
MEKELDTFSETQKINRLKALADAKRAAASESAISGSTTWHQSSAGGRHAVRTGLTTVQLKLIWIGSGLMAMAAAGLFLLH